MSSSSSVVSSASSVSEIRIGSIVLSLPYRGRLARGTIALIGISRIEASSDLHALLAEPCGFLLARNAQPSATTTTAIFAPS
jgi:hypothetical protein